MDDQKYEQWLATLVVRDDEAWTPGEQGFDAMIGTGNDKWGLGISRKDDPKAYRRAYEERRRQDPEYVETLRRRNREYNKRRVMKLAQGVDRRV